MTDQPQHRLRELFEFDAKTGHLIWRSRPVEDFATVLEWSDFNTQFAGTVAGCINGNGYREISIDGKKPKAHRLIWAYVNGDIPAGMQIDHINGIRDDNRLENLRLVTNAENRRNQSMRSDNSSGVMGISWHRLGRKWQANIKIDGRSKHLGLFDTIEAAAAARARAEVKYGFHPGHGKVLEKTYASSR